MDCLLESTVGNKTYGVCVLGKGMINVELKSK